MGLVTENLDDFCHLCHHRWHGAPCETKIWHKKSPWGNWTRCTCESAFVES